METTLAGPLRVLARQNAALATDASKLTAMERKLNKQARRPRGEREPVIGCRPRQAFGYYRT